METEARINEGGETSSEAPISILLVDDDPDIRAELGEYLTANGFAIGEAPDARTALTQFGSSKFDLVVLDLSLGKDNGFDLLREIRQTHSTPCIMVTAHGDATDKVVGLELGADDYVVKPVNLRELLARIRALLRRSGRSGGDNRKGEDLWRPQDSDVIGKAWIHLPGLGKPLSLLHAPLPLAALAGAFTVYFVLTFSRPKRRSETD